MVTYIDVTFFHIYFSLEAKRMNVIDLYVVSVDLTTECSRPIELI